jgi:hypothetical protein
MTDQLEIEITMKASTKHHSVVVSTAKTKRGGEISVIRTEDGHYETVVTKPSSAAAIERAAKKYHRALRSLAKR